MAGIVTTLIVTANDRVNGRRRRLPRVGPEFIGARSHSPTGFLGLPLFLAALMAFVWLMLFIGFAYIAFSLFATTGASSTASSTVSSCWPSAEALTTLQDCGLSGGCDPRL